MALLQVHSISPLISNQIEAEKSTDLITGKGNGLTMLLHDGPSTGKTLMAESVAEIAGKPLYPVACGEMGTDPEEVESYSCDLLHSLESVLEIGKTWQCVVLLDEADVFLEQRGMEDLRRNALVSVFLRVLEYYDGILILRSNRLALHYESLSDEQRRLVWSNFISRLEDLKEEAINFDNLRDNLGKLVKYKLNGRQIRNIITTARQYVRWERQQQRQREDGWRIKLDYKMMKEVIDITGEFDKYTQKLNKGYTDDQIAEEDGVRLQDGVGLEDGE
ncbi:hypothetical protein F4777DRAFT_591880 [Nemania sp. FL0916]|nr:hypothetical protein F4777DRAFT_591880 [Nemania sp. FL0916]